MHRNVAFLCIAFLPLYVCVPCPIDTFNFSFCNHSAQLYRSRSPIDPDGFSEFLCHSSESCRMGCASCTAESNADLINPPFSIPGRCHWPYNEMRLFNDKNHNMLCTTCATAIQGHTILCFWGAKCNAATEKTLQPQRFLW